MAPEKRRLLLAVDRHLTAVDPVLRKLLGDLVMGRAPWPLFLFGPAGGGKTCAALALCDVVETAGYWTVDGLCDLTMRPPADAIQSAWDRISTKHLAVLDEIGCRERVGDLHYDVVKRFADARYQHAGRAMICISNVAHDRLSRLYDDRIASRLLAGTVFELKAPDRRRVS
jgi:DNA replication protein DnaC